MLGLTPLGGIFRRGGAITESSIRLPPGAPLVASIDAPVLPRVYLVLLVALLIGVVLQVGWLREVPVSEPNNS